MRRLDLLSTLVPLRATAECVAGETIRHSGTVIRHTVNVSLPTMSAVAQRPPSHNPRSMESEGLRGGAVHAPGAVCYGSRDGRDRCR